jgi:hypothetical protein
VLDLPAHPFIDKHGLAPGCVRLPLAVDAARFAAEVDALGPGVWGTAGGRVGVHSAAESLFLRGHAPAQGELPIEDREPLARLPSVRELLARLGSLPQRCLLARLPAGRVILPHVDRAPYFGKTVRVHVPVTTHDNAFLYCDGRLYRMRAGEAWALDNGARHGAWNVDATRDRTHLICDFVPDATLLALLAGAERNLGEPADEAALVASGIPR